VHVAVNVLAACRLTLRPCHRRRRAPDRDAFHDCQN
jgi:hypothetical protein